MQSIIGGLVAEGVKESPEDMATRNAAPSHWQTGHLALVDDAFVVGVVYYADQPEQAGLASFAEAGTIMSSTRSEGVLRSC